MAVQPTYYWGFDISKLSAEPTITITRGAFNYATFIFVNKKFYLGLADNLATSDHYRSFAAELTTLINVYASAAGDTAVWTVTWNHATLAFTISTNTGTFTAVLNTTMRQILGATADITPAVASWTSTIRPYYVIRPSVDSWRSDQHDYEPEGIATESETDDGDAYGLNRTAGPIYFELTQLYEPMAAVYPEQATGSVPWTWKHAFLHARNIQPIILVQAPWAQTTISYVTADVFARFRLRAQGASFRPGRHVAKPAVNTYWMIPLVSRLLEHP